MGEQDGPGDMRVNRAGRYRQVYGRPTEPGDDYYQHGDAAPGWSDWMWEFDVAELPGHPIDAVLRRYRELERAAR